MAKTCSSSLFGTSPNTFGYWNDWLVNDDFNSALIKADSASLPLDATELFDDLNWASSIHDDIKKLEDAEFKGDCFDIISLDKAIRNTHSNCMWSSTTSTISTTDVTAALSTSAMSNCSDSSVTGGVPLAVVNNNGTSFKMEQPCAPIVVVANNSKLQQHQPQQNIVLDIKAEIKEEPHDDYEQQLQQHSIPNSRTAQQSMQHIPAGTSLLRKTNVQQQQQQQQRKTKIGNASCSSNNNNTMQIQIPTLYAADCEMLTSANFMSPLANSTTTATQQEFQLNNSCSNSSSSNSYVRPDTPHSLDDDATSSLNSCSSSDNTTEFKHNIDLRACVMGSNNISLTADPTNYINNISQELQDTTKEKIDPRYVVNSGLSVNDVLNVVRSDCDSEDDDDEDLDDDMDSDQHQHQQHQQQQQHSYLLHSDHSYTRCKDGMDDDLVGNHLDTPSESEDEEIDVVSVSDKKFPTNPSDKDRHVLRTKIERKFSNANIVKTANGVRTKPARRHGYYELPYTPASNSPVKSVVNSRYPSPASTPHQGQYRAQFNQQLQHVFDASKGIVNDKSRKRVAIGGVVIPNNILVGADHGLTPAGKKHRGKKVFSSKGTMTTITPATTPGAVLKRQYSTDEAADTIEKRNLHNDMERQRRVGLKNLFEALKKQIPSIKDKERAPKVNILREAAKLCEALTREDQQLCEQKSMLKEQLRKRQELLARLRTMQRD